MRIASVIGLAIGVYSLFYLFLNLVVSLRNKKYQKIWDKEKSMHVKNNPSITNAKLCEYFVMFCKRNDCIVEF